MFRDLNFSGALTLASGSGVSNRPLGFEKARPNLQFPLKLVKNCQLIGRFCIIPAKDYSLKCKFDANWGVMKQRFAFARTGPDFLMNELTESLRQDGWFEFNALFLEIYDRLKLRKATGGGEEMLRLRMYEKLQKLVQGGIVERSGKSYRGKAAALAAFVEQIAEQQNQRTAKVAAARKPVKATSSPETL